MIMMMIVLFYKILMKKIYFHKKYKNIFRVLLLTSVSAVVSFFLQTALGYNVNITSESFIFITNFIAAPFLFFFISTEKDLNITLLIRIMTIFTLIVVGGAIINKVGYSFNQFDAQNRIQLPFTVNTMASTSISLVLSFCFALNMLILYIHKKKLITTILLFLLGFEIYLMSSRFAILIILFSILHLIINNNIRKKYKIALVIPIILVMLITVSNMSTINVNNRFLTEIKTFKKITDPLGDTSLAIRVGLWFKAVEDIKQNPIGYGYLRFVYNNTELDPVLGMRGFNTHNELLLQLLGIGWFPTILLIIFFFRASIEIILRIGYNYYLPFLVALVISATFETFSNNPNSINAMPLVMFSLGVYMNDYFITKNKI